MSRPSGHWATSFILGAICGMIIMGFRMGNLGSTLIIMLFVAIAGYINWLRSKYE